MIYYFNIKGINVEVNTENRTVKYNDTPQDTIITTWYSKWFRVEDQEEKIYCYFDFVKRYATGKIVSTGYKIIENKNTELTISGVGQYDFFNQLTTGDRGIGDIANHARLNNLLENLTEVFGEKIPCFNPYKNWEFFHPIELSLTVTPTTILDNLNQEDGIITATIENPVAGMSYEYSIDGISWQISNVFTNLSKGIYNVYARSTSELVSKIKSANIE